MKMEWEQHRSGTVVTLSGDVISEDMDVFKRRFEEHLQEGMRLVVDLRTVDRVDSACLEGLLWLHEYMQHNTGQLRVVVGNGQPFHAMRVTRVDRQFTTHQSIDAAARSFTRGQAA